MFDSAGDLTQTGYALAQVFPDLGTVAPLRVLGEGFRSTVVETARGSVFRIGRNRAAAEGYAREVRLLPRLQGVVPAAVPDPRWHSHPSVHFPFGIMGYPRLQGTSLLPEILSHANVTQLASDVAAFLLALHRFPVEEAEALGLQTAADSGIALEALRDDVLPPLRDVLTGKEHQTVARWWDSFLADERIRDYTPVLRHGDLWYEHILVDGALPKVVGVVDFEDASVGDPAQDFATQIHLGEEFAARVIDSYRAAGGILNQSFHHRVRRLWELREFGGIQFAVRFDDPAELADSVRKLRSGPILSEGQ